MHTLVPSGRALTGHGDKNPFLFEVSYRDGDWLVTYHVSLNLRTTWADFPQSDTRSQMCAGRPHSAALANAFSYRHG